MSKINYNNTITIQPIGKTGCMHDITKVNDSCFIGIN